MCWVDNSATRQIACKLGAGRLRRISGGSLEVKQIGTAYNLADIGAKPLSKTQRHGYAYFSFGAMLEMEMEHVEKGKIMKVATYLNRLMMLGSLELNTDMVTIDPNYKIPSYMLIFIIVIGALVSGAMALWNKFKRLEQAYIINQLEADKGKITRRIDGSRLHGAHLQGLEAGSVSGAEWDYSEYLEAVNQRHDGLRLRKCWRHQDQLRSERGGGPEIRRLPNLTAEQRARMEGFGTTAAAAPEVEENLSGDTVAIRLDSGKVVDAPVEYVEPSWG